VLGKVEERASEATGKVTEAVKAAQDKAKKASEN
jgi:hypothetical protein